MITPLSTAKIIGIFALAEVISSQAIQLILADVTVDNVQQDNNTQAMRFINERL